MTYRMEDWLFIIQDYPYIIILTTVYDIGLSVYNTSLQLYNIVYNTGLVVYNAWLALAVYNSTGLAVNKTIG